MDKVRMLIVSTDMHVGGVTTALLSLLDALDYRRFAVDLMLYDHDGPLHDRIPASVNLLPPGRAEDDGSRSNLMRKLSSPGYLWGRAQALVLEKLLKKPIQGMQVRARCGAHFSRKVDAAYDVAISFIEFWPMYYVAFHVDASIKLMWVHVDYMGGLLSPRWDAAAIARCDRLVMVSTECVSNFQKICPRYARKAVFLPNLLSQQVIREQAQQPPAWHLPEDGRLKLITVSRVVFQHKGLDRGVEAFAQLRDQGRLREVAWYIIGDGPDDAALRRMIDERGLQDVIFPLGRQLRPLPIVAQADAFFLPSRLEGKPLAVTEAQMLGLPALVAHYASAPEQVEHGVDGLIFDNSQAGVTEGLADLLARRERLTELKQNVLLRNYGNAGAVVRLYQLLDEIRREADGK